MKAGKILMTLAAAGMTLSAAAQQIPQFQAGEKVVLMGDSITHGGHYHSYIWLYYMTRFPDMRIEMVNAGMGGECAWDMAERFDDDIFGRKPSYVTLTFGMNDTGYFDVFAKPDAKTLAQERVEKSISSFHMMEEKLAAHPEIRTVMIGGSPYDETKKPGRSLTGKQDAMRQIIAEQKAAADRHGWGFVDFHDPMVEISVREQQKDSTFTFSRLERIHPDCDGQMVMAYLFLKAQGLAGKKVADISLQAGKKKVRKSENCRISGVESSKDKVSFDYLASSLPYPVDSIAQNGWANKKSAKDAMELIPFMEEFNQELLTVTSLEPGTYSLSIDGGKITEVSADELASGINLAKYTNTPQYLQASSVMYLNEERLQMERRLVEYLWVEYEYLRKEGMLFQDDDAAMRRLRQIAEKDIFLNASLHWYKQAVDPEVRNLWKDYIGQLTDRIYTINKPVQHRIEIERIR